MLTLTTLLLLTTQLSIADEAQKPTISIKEMEINLAKLAKEISEEKVKLYQKEALLNAMKLDLLKQKKSKNK